MLRDVHEPSTIYETTMVPKGQLDHIATQSIMKPTCIKEYNENIGAIEKSDVQISFSKRARKAIVWYEECFFPCASCDSVQCPHFIHVEDQKTPHLPDFRLEAIRSTIVSIGSQRSEGKGRLLIENPTRSTARYFPSFIKDYSAEQSSERR